MRYLKNFILFYLIFIFCLTHLISEDNKYQLNKIYILYQPEYEKFKSLELLERTTYEQAHSILQYSGDYNIHYWIEEVYKEVGTGKEINKNDLIKETYKLIQNSWDNSIKLILNNDKVPFWVKENIKTNLEKHNAFLTFTNWMPGGEFPWARTVSMDQIQIQLNGKKYEDFYNKEEGRWKNQYVIEILFKKIIKVVAKKLMGELDDISWEDLWKHKDIRDFICTLIHEIFHQRGEINRMDNTSSSEKSAECMVECLTYVITGRADSNLRGCERYYEI